jgi:hypothetical protein
LVTAARFPLDYQTTSYISSVVEDFGLLVVWDNPRGNNKFVLVKVHIVHPKFVPKTLVVHEEFRLECPYS